MVEQLIKFMSIVFSHMIYTDFKSFYFGGCDGLERTVLTVSTLGGCGTLERTYF